jgi:hypothetical protein
MTVTAENLLLSIVKEVTPGVTPATPVFLEANITSESIAPDPTYTESEMIRGGTRGVTDTVLTQMSTGGDISRELVYEPTTKLLLETILGNLFGADPHTNGITASQLYDYTTLVSLSIEKKWQMDPTPTYDYHMFVGNVAASATIDFSPGEIITMSTSFVGLSYSLAKTGVTGATYTPPVGNPPMTTPLVTSIVLTDVGTETPVAWMSTVCFTELSLAFENNTRALACIGSLQAKEIAMGRLGITASGSIYYNSDVPLASLLNEQEFGLLIEAADAEDNKYKFFLPRVKFTSADVLATGQSSDVVTNFTLTALQDVAKKYSIIITATDKPTPPVVP